MPIVASYHYIIGPVVAIGAVGVLVLLSRWAFGTGAAVVRRPAAAGPHDFGLLTPVATVSGRGKALALRRALAAGDVRATLAAAESPGDVHVLVFHTELDRARVLLDNAGR